MFDVVVWAEPELRDETADFEGLLIDLPDGSQAPLSELATIETVDAPLNIRRDAVSRFADVEVQVEGRSSAAVADDIESGRFADEWDAERDAGYPTLTRLKEQHAGPAVREYEAELRRRLGPNIALQS